MAAALQLYGLLILTVLGFALPILTVLFSLFPEGTRALSDKTENERRQSEDNIRSETGRREAKEPIDIGSLEQILKKLKKRKAQAESKLRYLSPHGLALAISIPAGEAFLLLMIGVQDVSASIRAIAILASLGAFGLAVMALSSTIRVLSEVSELVNANRRSTESRIVDLLTNLAERGGIENLFLKEGDVWVTVDGKTLTKESELTFSVNKKHDLAIVIVNHGEMIAKIVEVGMTLPTDVLVEKAPHFWVFSDEEEQVVRFKADRIQAHTKLVQGKMGITLLRAGRYDVGVFIKGENVRYSMFTVALVGIE
jgi:hypothetical protein